MASTAQLGIHHGKVNQANKYLEIKLGQFCVTIGEMICRVNSVCIEIVLGEKRGIGCSESLWELKAGTKKPPWFTQLQKTWTREYNRGKLIGNVIMALDKTENVHTLIIVV